MKLSLETVPGLEGVLKLPHTNRPMLLRARLTPDEQAEERPAAATTSRAGRANKQASAARTGAR